MNVLESLIQKARPLHEFEFDGQKLFARAMSSADERMAGTVWKSAYDSALHREIDEQDAMKKLNLSTKEELIKYVLTAEEQNTIQECASLLEQLPSAPEVKEEVKKQQAKREENLQGQTFEDVYEIAMKYRVQVSAQIEAIAATMRFSLARQVFYKDEKDETVSLFPGQDDVDKLPGTVVREMSMKVSQALRPTNPFRDEPAAPVAEGVESHTEDRRGDGDS